MKHFCLFFLFSVAVAAQPSVKGTILLHSAAHSRDYIVRNTKVVLQSGLSIDTVNLDENLQFEFDRATKGPASLYLISPVLTRAYAIPIQGSQLPANTSIHSIRTFSNPSRASRKITRRTRRRFSERVVFCQARGRHRDFDPCHLTIGKSYKLS